MRYMIMQTLGSGKFAILFQDIGIHTLASTPLLPVYKRIQLYIGVRIAPTSHP
mgnify:CR=1 FL=1